MSKNTLFSSFILIALILLILTGGFISSVNGFWGISIIYVGEADVTVYVIALDGVNASGVNDVSRMVEGILSACRVNSSCYYTEEVWAISPIVLGEIKINTTPTIVEDWKTYKKLIEKTTNAIIINVHGEVLPVPSGYTKETWTDKIAEAMLTRNITWVHTTGYPLYNYQYQNGTQGEWKEKGFQRLMSHIGLNNVTCRPKVEETELISMHTHARDFIESFGWDHLEDAFYVEHGRPLNCSYFKDYIILPIWGTDIDYATGAIVRFAPNNQTNPGIYVHIGTYQTYDSLKRPTDADFMRGYAGAAAAIWTSAYKTVAKKKITEAKQAIAKAEADGRTKGLDQAKQLLNKAKEYYQLGYYLAALETARQAKKTANHTTKPNFLEAYGLHLTIAIIAGTIIATTLTIKRKQTGETRNTSRCPSKAILPNT